MSLSKDRAELRFAFPALEPLDALHEVDASPGAFRARHDSVRPAKRFHKLKRPALVGKINNRFLQRLRQLRRVHRSNVNLSIDTSAYKRVCGKAEAWSGANGENIVPDSWLVK